MLCPNCQGEMRVIPAGVSKKTGKAYRAFEVCETLACKALKEQSRYNVPPSYQNRTEVPNYGSQRELEELRIQIGELNQVIAKMRTAFANHEERIKTLETLNIDLKGEAAFNLHSAPTVNTTEIPIVQATDGDKINIELPDGFLKK